MITDLETSIIIAFIKGGDNSERALIENFRTTKTVVRRAINNYLKIKKETLNKEHNMNVFKIQDHEGDWYWIPERKVADFHSFVEDLSDMDYSDNPEFFETFNDIYSRFLTGGDMNVRPEFFKHTEVTFLN